MNINEAGVNGYVAMVLRHAKRFYKGGYESGFLANGLAARRHVRTGRVEMFLKNPDRWIPAHADHWHEFKTTLAHS